MLSATALDPATLRSLARGTSHDETLPNAEQMAAVERAHVSAVRAGEAGRVYGLTTGVGALKDVPVGEVGDQDGERSLRLWRSHAAGVGPEADDDVARATMLVRLQQLLRGGAGVSPGLVRGLAEACGAGVVPRLHTTGAIGTGDLAQLSELGLTLAGELPWKSGERPPARVAATDGLAFVSSNALTVATAALAVADLDDLAEAADRVAALSHLGLLGAMEAYDARALASKHDPWAAGVAERLRHLLGDGPEAARLQDPFALRTVPQVHGTLREALATARSALTAEIGAGSENPLVTDDGVLHHGHFLTQRLATSLDTVRAAAHPFAALSAARTSALMDPRLTGLPPFLAADTAGSSGLMILEYVAADLVTRARRLAAPTTTGAVLSLGLEEHASFSTQGARAARELIGVLVELLGCELVAAVRALRLAPERALDCPARELLERGRAVLPDIADDHVLGPDIRAATALLTRTG